jgi:hypothetical protein
MSTTAEIPASTCQETHREEGANKYIPSSEKQTCQGNSISCHFTPAKPMTNPEQPRSHSQNEEITNTIVPHMVRAPSLSTRPKLFPPRRRRSWREHIPQAQVSAECNIADMTAGIGDRQHFRNPANLSKSYRLATKPFVKRQASWSRMERTGISMSFQRRKENAGNNREGICARCLLGDSTFVPLWRTEPP